MLAQTTVNDGGSSPFLIIYVLSIFVLSILPYWVIFQKAGRDGWRALIPIYNLYVVMKIVGRPGWWLLLLLIPLVNLIVLIIVYNDLAKSFGKGTGFTVGLIFLNWIFLMILAFGSATYRGPSAPGAATGGGAIPPPPPPPPI